MCKIYLVFAVLACTGQGFRVQHAGEHIDRKPHDLFEAQWSRSNKYSLQKALTSFLVALKPAIAWRAAGAMHAQRSALGDPLGARGRLDSVISTGRSRLATPTHVVGFLQTDRQPALKARLRMAADSNLSQLPPGMPSTLGAFAESLGGSVRGPAASITLVTGNEASDCDSIVSALLYAYLLHHETKAAGGMAIPLIFCDREDFALRRETVYLLETCGVNCEHLVFLNDPGIKEDFLPRVSEVVLVDHNCATGPLAALDIKISAIIDHHKDLGAHSHITGDRRNIAFEGDQATAGSCASLIVEQFMKTQRGKELLSFNSGMAAKALLGPILVDTINLNPKAKKVTPRDVASVRVLDEIAPVDPALLFTQMDVQKFDQSFWKKLTVDQCLRYDYKEFESAGRKFGLASALIDLSDLALKPGWSEAAKQWASKVDLFGVLTNVRKEEGMHRQLLFLGEPELTDRLVDYMKNSKEPNFELEPLACPGPDALKAFRQHNIGLSRKQIAPALANFFASL